MFSLFLLCFVIKIKNSYIKTIFIFTDNVVKELETALSDIEEIDGALKIVRSFPIVSLSFFRSLKYIHGRDISDRYTMYVIDNQNLQSLFIRNVTISSGKLFFHFNPKLCYANIEALKDNVVDLRNLSKLPLDDVPANSNGDKVACEYDQHHFFSLILLIKM